MDHRQEVREFLVSRRARVDPGAHDLPDGGPRRVKGLRRGEVASLAGISVEYYARLERGALGTASDSVLDGIARALRFDEAERQHLFRLARTARAGGPTRGAARSESSWNPPASITWMLDSFEGSIAMIGNGRQDLLAWNALGRAFVDELLATTISGRPNFARFTFLEPAARNFYLEWDVAADMVVASLRAEAGRDPHSRELHELVGELSTRSDAFRHRWGAHDVRMHASGVKLYHHHAVGALALHFNSFDVVGAPGVRMTTFTAEPGSPSEDAIRLLGRWAEGPASSAMRAVSAERQTDRSVTDQSTAAQDADSLGPAATE